MKVKQIKQVDLTANEEYEIILNENSKAGDTVAREIVINCDGGLTITNSRGDSQKVMNSATFDVEDYAAEMVAIIPCEGIDFLLLTAESNCGLTYKILV